MVLFTKSIQVKVSKKDGVRICIMRSPGKYKHYDVWMRLLAPSSTLDAQVKKGMKWITFKKKFEKELKQNRYTLQLLAAIAKKQDVTLLGYGKEGASCHRSLVAEAVKKIDSKVKMVAR